MTDANGFAANDRNLGGPQKPGCCKWPYTSNFIVKGFTKKAIFEIFFSIFKVKLSIIISLEMYLYGGLIQSRISNDTTDEVLARWEILKILKNQNENLKIFASNVVMRIPSYDGDFEEPWYWANYGEWIFKYSFNEDKFQQTGDKRPVFVKL